MTGKFLGKITFAEYGTVKEYPFLIGLQLSFVLDGCSVSDGSKYTVNMGEECSWNFAAEKTNAVTASIEKVYKILNDAKVNYVSQLIGKPVEVTIEENLFRSFRILTEVL